MQVIVKYHKEKEQGTRNKENHMDENITCKGKEQNSEVHRMKRIRVMKKSKSKDTKENEVKGHSQRNRGHNGGT